MTQRKVVKLGGSVWDTLHPDYFNEWRTWLDAGHELVLIHGGGPALSAYCEHQQIEPVFQDGRRVTTADVLIGAERVLAGEMQTEIVAALGRHQIQAVGLSGVDGQTLTGKQLVELGAVGEVDQVETNLFELLLASRYVPVVTSLLQGPEGTLNCNGDDCAIAVAVALQADRFEMITDVPGIRIDGTVRQTLTREDIETAIASGQIYGGMIPKTEALLGALTGGIEVAVIRDGKQPAHPGTTLQEVHHAFTTTDIRTTTY
ncbi:MULTISPECIES: acetylglutamate kinase [Exiguobacterium]|uniref:acetylglutamate kinase n=1 Tax=Exiguobacterium TaxID=33986 RepID=UPI001BE68CF4|nr:MULTISPECIES: acetylglutamate kinase [Exiguobacterium]MCT4778427.1 acetylglutamate kinase [Exiguobacterium aquaticum]MCT4790043.1 acetylglutamate kinase [Exiguobacterium mexicanum]